MWYQVFTTYVACQVEALIDEYFNSGDLQEASTSLQVGFLGYCTIIPNP